MREARDEAKKEVEAYRRAKDEEFKKFEAEVCPHISFLVVPPKVNTVLIRDSSQHTQGNKQAEDEANREAEAKIKEIQAAGQKSQAKVVEDLLKAVFDVKPVPPERA